MNLATHCDRCGDKLEADRYDVAPNGGLCKIRAWCPSCYEFLVKEDAKYRVSQYTEREKDEHEFALDD